MQLGLGFSPLKSGLMMVPTAIAGIAAKYFGPKLIVQFGYRRVLIVNTFLVGLGIAWFSLIAENLPFWYFSFSF